jgi:hypothetical protein
VGKWRPQGLSEQLKLSPHGEGRNFAVHDGRFPKSEAYLEFEEIAAAPRQDMQLRQGAADRTASTAFDRRVVRSVGEVRNLDRQAAAIEADNLEAGSFPGVFLR